MFICFIVTTFVIQHFLMYDIFHCSHKSLCLFASRFCIMINPNHETLHIILAPSLQLSTFVREIGNHNSDPSSIENDLRTTLLSLSTLWNAVETSFEEFCFVCIPILDYFPIFAFCSLLVTQMFEQWNWKNQHCIWIQIQAIQLFFGSTFHMDELHLWRSKPRFSQFCSRLQWV